MVYLLGISVSQLSADGDPRDTLVSILGDDVTKKIDVFAGLYKNGAALVKETDNISIGKSVTGS